MPPKVSILWLNYNSSSFKDLAFESLNAVKNLNYENYEIILVDNGSSDNSFLLINEFAKKINLNFKSISLANNLGFAGGNNAAYRAKDSDSKYVALLNNDAVPISGSLTKLVDLMEGDDQLGAVQGVILNEDGKTIDTAGDYVTELLSVRSLFKGDPPNSLKKPVYATSADAAFSLFRVKAIEQIPHQTNCIFDSCLFGCLDDHLLGLKLWNVGFKIKVYPIITARHRRGSSFRKVHALQVYLGLRNLVFVNEISNSRYKNIIRLDCFKQVVTYFPRVFSNNASKELPAILSKAFIDGLKYGHVKRNVGEKIDLYKAPILKLSPFNAFVSTIVSRRFIQNKVEQELRNITD